MFTFHLKRTCENILHSDLCYICFRLRLILKDIYISFIFPRTKIAKCIFKASFLCKCVVTFKIRSGGAANAIYKTKPAAVKTIFRIHFHKSIFIFQIRLINHIIPQLASASLRSIVLQ